MRQSPPGCENLAGFFFAAHLLPLKSGRCRASAKAATARSQCLPNSRYWLHPDWAGYWSHTAGGWRLRELAGAARETDGSLVLPFSHLFGW